LGKPPPLSERLPNADEVASPVEGVVLADGVALGVVVLVVVPLALGGVEDSLVVLQEDRMADQVEEDRRHRGMVHLTDTMVPGERLAEN
jgi:hypothetical protein